MIFSEVMALAGGRISTVVSDPQLTRGVRVGSLFALALREELLVGKLV
jgi:hypothetical protein